MVIYSWYLPSEFSVERGGTSTSVTIVGSTSWLAHSTKEISMDADWPRETKPTTTAEQQQQGSKKKRGTCFSEYTRLIVQICRFNRKKWIDSGNFYIWTRRNSILSNINNSSSSNSPMAGSRRVTTSPINNLNRSTKSSSSNRSCRNNMSINSRNINNSTTTNSTTNNKSSR